MSIDSQNLSINNVFAEPPSHSAHDIIAAMLNVFLVIVPWLDISGNKSCPKLLPPREHAMKNVPLSRGKVKSTSLREIVDVCTVDGQKLGKPPTSVEFPNSKYGQDPSAPGPEPSNSTTRSLSMHESGSQSTAI